MTLTHIDAQQVEKTLSPKQAVQALRDYLQQGFDPSTDLERSRAEITNGDFLLMPSNSPTGFGIKLISIPGKTADPSIPSVNGIYVLFDGSTLQPIVTIDGVALTNLRTPAVSLAGVSHLLTTSSQPLDVVIVGVGAQGRAHAETVESVCEDIRETNINFISRTQPDDLDNWLQAGSDAAHEAIRNAELIITTTTSPQPVIEDTDVRDDAVIVAVGSHSPDARELPGALLARAQVIMEEEAAAFREAGDIIQAVDEGNLDKDSIATFAQVVRSEVQLHRNTPVVFKFTGMPWEDLALAEAIAAQI
ncbi:ornithine cyclodeaminase family protein [Corynebacterium stationis]|uniref:ornithine cyclodeaminase family protein n=1 Tax=Corynebacterium stationis TaxID=1705 RepID=UPI00076F66C7|nr:ornithine cyclodeaminase family protein [Corynebacterium stationis]AMJ44094.1 ornithine cyclodeaminase [Corynebacterium stationis]AQX70553.1 ornithine cyclodeaminase [Corynebacterium stationis]ASJ18246.1 ornithine cyclodeaminase [Corynebacterium stationis]HJG65160.1 ornithine cyclodeaminase family protein [Corynebacterium stationis]